MTARTTDHHEDVKRAAMWLADRQIAHIEQFAPHIPVIKNRFGLTDADAAEAILLAGNYSLCRRAFG